MSIVAVAAFLFLSALYPVRLLFNAFSAVFLLTIPICEDLHPEDKDNYEINQNTVKAIKLSVEEVKALRKAASVGINSKKTAEKALKSKRRGYWSDRKRAEAEKTIDIFKRITA